MKRTGLLIIVLVIVLGALPGCRKESNEDILKVGIDLKYPPFMYLDDNGVPAGLEPDLSRAFGEYLGKEVEIVNTDFSMLIASLETGEVDIVISDMSVTEERKQKLDFSTGYRYGRIPVLVNKSFYDEKEITDEMSPEEFFALDGLKAIGLSGTFATTIPGDYGVEAAEATEIATAIIEVTTGSSNVIVGSYVIFGDHAANPDTTEIFLGLDQYSTSAFAVKRGNTELLEKANEFIHTLYEDGGLYEELAEKYDEVIHEVFFSEKYGLDFVVTKPE